MLMITKSISIACTLYDSNVQNSLEDNTMDTAKGSVVTNGYGWGRDE